MRKNTPLFNARGCKKKVVRIPLRVRFLGKARVHKVISAEKRPVVGEIFPVLISGKWFTVECVGGKKRQNGIVYTIRS